LRVKALKLFDESEHARTGGTSRADLEIAVQGLMSLMEPSYMEGKTETATHMRRLLYAGTIAVADASDGISEEEIKIFEKFFGMGEYSKNIDLPRLKEDLPDRSKKARDNTSVPQRMQVLRDLCLVAKASGRTTRQERAVLEGIADDLDIPRGFLCQTMEQQVGPD